MITTHGREGKPWLTTSLAASGLLLFALAGARPANGCHIKHEHKDHSSSTDTTSSTTSGSSTMTPEDKVHQAFQNLLHDIPAQTSQPMIPAPASSTPTSSVSTSSTTTSSAPMAPALPQILVPSPASGTPSVANWHQSAPNSMMPPTPPAMCDGPSMSGSQGMTPPSPGSALTPPAAFLTPTAAPEPSTLLLAGVLAGAFAWRRRSKSKSE